jgi:hypothetical protein
MIPTCQGFYVDVCCDAKMYVVDGVISKVHQNINDSTFYLKVFGISLSIPLGTTSESSTPLL